VDVYINYLRRKVDSGYDRPVDSNYSRHGLPNRLERIRFVI
jgi:hypothetical protein